MSKELAIQHQPITLRFDYGKVDSSVRDIVEKAAIEIKLLERRAAEDLIVIGNHLIAVKELLPYGQWLEWINIEFTYSQRYAYDLINVAGRFGNRVALCAILGSSVMRLLAAPSIPDEVIDVVVEKTQAQGHPLQVNEVMEIRDIYRQVAAAANAEWSESELARREKVEQGKTVIANMKNDTALIAWATTVGLYERIDRATIWGNPFVVDEDGTCEECILKYEDYYFMKSSLWPKLESLRGKVLGCWCYPEDCHGQVLINFLKFDAENPFKALGFGYPIGTADDFERFTEMHSLWAALHYLEEHG